VPVPRMVLYVEDRSLIGTPFYLMARVPGRVFHACALEEAAPVDRRAMYRSLAETLAALHNVNPEAAGLGSYGRKESYFARQIARWSQQWALSKQADNADMERLITWLPAHIPPQEACAISHGDYRLGNVLFAPHAPEVAAVLDWELSTLGHPLADLAHCCIAWHATPEEYGGIDGLDRASLNLPEQHEFEAWYGACAGHGLRLEPFHLAFALFRFAAVFEGITARAKAGNANDANAASYAALTGKFAARAVKLIG
jgi:aminoglycoside phosphotransferase (APT) family kinase protein